MPAGKAPKKKNQQSKSLTSLAAIQSVHDVTVRDCLQWPDNKKQSTTTGQDDVVYVSMRQRHQQQQQSKSSIQTVQMRPLAPIEDDATVGDALRGWPRYMRQYEQMMQQKMDNVTDEQTQTKSKTGQAKKTSKSKSKSNVTKNKDEDIHVADLISQRFLHEYMEQRQAEMEREQRKKEARERAAREGRRAAKDRTDIKANKAAQLRSIALADRVESSPFDLWKMEKFTRSARPHISTFRNGHGQSGASASGASAAGASDGERGRRGGNRGRYGGSTGGEFSGRSSTALEDEEFSHMAGACTCPDKLSYYEGRDVYDTYGCSDGYLTTDIDNFGDGNDCIYTYVETSHQSSSPISAL